MTIMVPILVPVVPHIVSSTVREWSLAHLSLVIPGAMIGVGSLCYWWWARGDASARSALRQIALHGRIAMPAGDLTPNDLTRNPRLVGSTATFLPRRLRRFESPNHGEFSVAGAIPSLLPGKGQSGRRVAFVGAAAMGKTRLVHQLVRELPPDTMVFAPSRNLGSLGDADLRRSTRFIGGKSCVLVYDDLNFYVGRTDVAELEQVVAEQACDCSTVVTCTTSTLHQVRSETEPALNRFFSSLDQYELLRMTDEQMDLLAADPTGPAQGREPQNYGGNPGLLLLDFQRLRGEFNSLGHEEVAILEAIHALFLAGIAPITVEQVRALVSSGYGAELGMPSVGATLDHLRLMSFLRETDPVLPEEAFIREFFSDDAVRKRMDEVEAILWLQGNARGLFQLGSTHHQNGDPERSSRAMGLAAQLDRAAGTPLNLANAAQALFNVALSLESLERPPQDIEAAYREAAVAGRESAAPEGLVSTAYALSNLGDELARWERPVQEVEAAYREAAVAGRESCTPDGLVASAKALSNLGIALARRERPPDEIETTYREAAAAGLEANTPEGLAATAQALLNLGIDLVRWERPLEEVETTLREAATKGRESCTADGMDTATRALVNVANALARWEQPPQVVEAAYGEAAEAGREADTPEGLIWTAAAYFSLGDALLQWKREPQEVEAAWHEAAAVARAADTPEGLAAAARVLLHLADNLADWGRAPQEIESVLRDAEQLGSESATPEGADAMEKVSKRLQASGN